MTTDMQLNNMPATLNICIPLHFCCSLHIEPTFLHTPIKINQLQHIFTRLLQSKCEEQICPPNATYRLHAQITSCASMGKVCQYVNHAKCHCEQNCGLQEWQQTNRQMDSLHLHKLVHQIS